MKDIFVKGENSNVRIQIVSKNKEKKNIKKYLITIGICVVISSSKISSSSAGAAFYDVTVGAVQSIDIVDPQKISNTGKLVKKQNQF